MGSVPPYFFGLAFLIVAFAVLQYTGRLPSTESIQQLANVMNTKGGIILVLACFSIMFFLTGMGFAYWTLNRMLEGKLTADNAIVMTAIQWITGGCFGGAFSSMIKEMSGEPPPPVTTNKTINTVTTEVAGDGK